MDGVEIIAQNGRTFALILRAWARPSETTFVTTPPENFQVGFVVYPTGGRISPHLHHPLQRSIQGTPEAIYVREGRCQVDIYDDDRSLLASLELSDGDVAVFFGGGHGFQMLEDTVLLEVKQGPYLTTDEKQRF